MYMIFILCFAIIFLVIVLIILKEEIKEKFAECLLDSSCKCDLNKNCKFQKELEQCNMDLLNIGQICKLERNSALKHIYDMNLPFINNSQKLQDEIDKNEVNQNKCINEYNGLHDLNDYLIDINLKYKSMVDKLNNQLSDVTNINSDSCP